MISKTDRIKGVMAGMAVADALGVPHETGKPVPDTGPVLEGGGYGFAPAEWSDDTQQAICLLRGLRSPLPAAGVAVELLKWYSDPDVRDIGPTSGRVLGQVKSRLARKYLRGDIKSPELVAAMTQIAAEVRGTSNGSLMRTAPVGLLPGGRDAVAAMAYRISDLTHGGTYTGDAAVLWSLAVQYMVDRGWEGSTLKHSESLREVLEAGLPYIPQGRREFWRSAVSEALDTADIRRFRSNSSAVGAFKAALWAVSHALDYESIVKLAVAIGGDTDTVAAIAGGLAGAMYGASTIPDEWYRQVHGWPGLKVADLEQLALELAGE